MNNRGAIKIRKTNQFCAPQLRTRRSLRRIEKFDNPIKNTQADIVFLSLDEFFGPFITGNRYLRDVVYCYRLWKRVLPDPEPFRPQFPHHHYCDYCYYYTFIIVITAVAKGPKEPGCNYIVISAKNLI